MFVVKKKKDESVNRLISRFKKKALDEGIVLEAKKRSRFTKPSQERQERKKKIAHLIELEKKRNY